MEETNYKAIAVVAIIVVALFAGGLYYVISESNNRSVALDLTRQYLNASPSEQVALEVLIRSRIEKPPIAMTSRASFDSFDQLIANAKACEAYAVQVTMNPRGGGKETDEAWRYCMDNPEVLNQKR